MGTIRYGDVVNAENTLDVDTLDVDTLEEKLRKRRTASQELQDLEANTEDQQAEINTEHESK